MLADAVQAADGKINLLGGGWSVTSSPTAPFGVAVKVSVPWHLGNQDMEWRLFLIDEDGRPAPLQTPIALGGVVGVPRHEALPAGTPLDLPMVFQFPSLPLEPGRYEWRFQIADMEGSVSFWVR